jgi:pepF/M3 family oligoendopeptidase
MSEKEYPRWDLTNVYPSIDSNEFKQAKDEFKKMIENLEEYVQENGIDPNTEVIKEDDARLAEVIKVFLQKVNTTYKLGWTIRAYLSSFIATDAFDEAAKKESSSLEPLSVRLSQQEDVLFKGWLGKLGERLPEIIKHNEYLQGHAFYLQEVVEQSQFMMSSAEEELASELSLSGGSIWAKLQGDMTSMLNWDVENENGEIESLPITAIIGLRSHASETMRRRGYEAELEAWKSIEVPLAFAMNGIKGQQNTLYKRRGRVDSVHDAVSQGRIDHETLEAMLSAMKASFPVFRKYFKGKAKRLGKEQLAWWDLFAPMGKSEKTYSYSNAKDLVIENFAIFSEDMADMAQRAFANNWVDVGPRKGKRAGAFCMRVPGVDESRILMNFNHSLDSVLTLAHELGHAFHNQCLLERTILQSSTPMTMAETASIMCETVLANAALKMTDDPDEELYLLETMLVGDSQVVVDIYSRYLFETEVFKRRDKSMLSADELNEIMESAQKETYGDGLDPRYLQKYMWTWKPHYYRPGLSFYNFPYTFGKLFATGLYAIYQEQGEAFVEDYKKLLSSTGMGNAADLAAQFGIDIRSTKFWEGSLSVIEKRIDRYLEL